MVDRRRRVILAVLTFFLTACAAKKVWYQQDIPDSMVRTDLDACSATANDMDKLGRCMRAKGYLLIPEPQAELLAVRSLQEEGLSADEIAPRLGWDKKKVLRYLDEEYELPRTASLGRQPLEVLMRIGKPAVKPLIADLKDNNPLVRRHAVQALGVLKDPRAVEPLVAVLNDKDPLIQRQAIKALGKIEDHRAVDPLIAVLNDKNKESHVRMSAAEALGWLGESSAVEPLVVALTDEHWDVRSHAAEALGRIEDPLAVEPLIAALKDRDATVRGYAVDALAKIKDLRAIEPLAAALRDKSAIVRNKAARALREVSGVEFESDSTAPYYY